MEKLGMIALGIPADKESMFQDIVTEIRLEERSKFDNLVEFLKGHAETTKNKKFAIELKVFLKNLGVIEDTEPEGSQVTREKKKREKILCTAFTKRGVPCTNEGRKAFNGMCGTHRKFSAGEEAPRAPPGHDHPLDGEEHPGCRECDMFGNILTTVTDMPPRQDVVVGFELNQFAEDSLNDF